jgi:hypothetical protein
MTDQHSPQKSPSGEDDNPSMSLVKWLVIIAIGIPVLIEVGTFGGMFFQRLSDGEHTEQEQRVDTERLTTGSTIALTESVRLRINNMQLWASSGDWRFVMEVMVVDESGSNTAYEQVTFSSLTTNGESVLDEPKVISLPASGIQTLEWTLPSGEQPRYVTIALPGEKAQTYPFSKIPTRMEQ